MDKTVCLDLDGVLAYYDKWRGNDHIGYPNPEGVKLANLLKVIGVKIIVDTCRLNHQWPDCDYIKVEYDIRVWLEKFKIPYDELWTCGGKPFAHAYVDDRGVHFPSNKGNADDAFHDILEILTEVT